MKKTLPKLKKTVKSFMVEEDAKLINKNASKIALSTAFISSIALINIDAGNAAPWSHSDHKDHSNKLEIGSPKSNMIFPKTDEIWSDDEISSGFMGFISGGDAYLLRDIALLNLGDANDEMIYRYDDGITVEIDRGPITETIDSERRGEVTSTISYDAYNFNVQGEPESTVGSEIASERDSVTTSTPTTGHGGASSDPDPTPDIVGDSQREFTNANDALDEEFSIDGQISPEIGITHGFNVEFEMPSTHDGDVTITFEDQTQSVDLPGLGESKTVTFDKTIEISTEAKADAKSVKAIHSNHYNKESSGGWF